MSDPFENHSPGLEAPASAGAPVTPDDLNDIAQACRFLWVGTGGDIAVVTVDGATIVFKGCQSGTILPVRVSRVRATGTTATDIVACW